ncbi:MAG TPA: thiamine phosphate synthase [Glycomyces sp.]|nr:thiamine phosphate synthase [Glycomyces sp.]
MRATRLPRLHVITDTRGPVALDRSGVVPPPQADPLVVVAAALAAGARLIQVRPEDHYNDRAAFDLATAIALLCDEYGAMCLVNDRVHIAQAVGADGVHLGAEDLPIDAARRLLPAASIIGGTSRDPESARAARRAGATYLGVGPVWGTTTKTGLPQPIGVEGLATVCEAVDLPVIAIGGITAERAVLCREAGAHGVAVVGAIAATDDPKRATAELLEAVGESPVEAENGAGLGTAANSERQRLDLDRSGLTGAERGSGNGRKTGPDRTVSNPTRPRSSGSPEAVHAVVASEPDLRSAGEPSAAHADPADLPRGGGEA